MILGLMQKKFYKMAQKAKVFKKTCILLYEEQLETKVRIVSNWVRTLRGF